MLGENTLVVQIEGQKYVSNGCQTSHSDKLDEICAEYDVKNTTKQLDSKQLVQNASNELNSDHSDLFGMVKINTVFLKYIKNQTPEICLAAVRQNGWALQFVKNQTPEICITAVKQNGYLLKYVKNQTEEICLSIVKQNVLVLEYVKNKTP